MSATHFDVEEVRDIARRAITKRIMEPGDWCILACEEVDDRVRLHVNSGGNAIECHWALWRAGWVSEVDEEYSGDGCVRFVSRRAASRTVRPHGQGQRSAGE